MSKVNVGIIQNRWCDDPGEAFDNILRTIDKVLSENNIDILCLPEFYRGAPWYMPSRGQYKGIIDDTVPGNTTDRLGELAKKYSTYILCGTMVERENDKYYNTCVVLDSNGEIAGKARKIHRYSSELCNIEAGTEQLIVDTPFGKIGVCICSDFWIPEMPRILALNGAEIIYVPGGSLLQNNETTEPVIIANSVYNACYTLYASIVGGVKGERAGRKISIDFTGNSAITGPRGLIGHLDDQEGVLIGSIDMDELHKIRQVDTSFKETLFWPIKGRKPELYHRLVEDEEEKTNLKEMVEDYLNSK